MTEKRVIWLVTDYGGEWEDKWDWNVRAFSDEVMAKECAERHEMRMKRDMDEYDVLRHRGRVRGVDRC